MKTTGRSMIRMTLAALAVTLLLNACTDDDADSNSDGAADTTTETIAREGDAAATTAFCDEAPDPSAEVAESYVGSAEHLDDLHRLRVVSPDEVLDDLDAIISHFEDEVDPADPDSQLMENFPDEVNEATRRVVAFTEEHCGA